MTTKEINFPLEASLRGERLVALAPPGKVELLVTAPPEFKGEHPELWSPEDLLVAAVASCFVVTLTGILQRRQLSLTDGAISAVGQVGERPDGRFGFTAIDLSASLETEPGDEEAVAQAAHDAEGCLVAVSLALPVSLSVVVLEPGRQQEFAVRQRKLAGKE